MYTHFYFEVKQNLYPNFWLIGFIFFEIEIQPVVYKISE